MTLAATSRTRLFVVSAISRPPVAVTATPLGPLRLASVAEPPSPAKPATPLPATVVMIAVRADAADAVAAGVGDEVRDAVGCDGHVARAVDLREHRRTAVAHAAGDAGPHDRADRPDGAMRRIRLPAVSATSSEPSPSSAMPRGPLSCAAAAIDPSPTLPATPVPARVTSVSAAATAGATSTTAASTAAVRAAVRRPSGLRRSIPAYSTPDREFLCQADPVFNLRSRRRRRQRGNPFRSAPLRGVRYASPERGR